MPPLAVHAFDPPDDRIPDFTTIEPELSSSVSAVPVDSFSISASEAPEVLAPRARTRVQSTEDKEASFQPWLFR